MARSHEGKVEKLYVEDLAALERMNDDSILYELKNRFNIGASYTFVGDILLSLNPNKGLLAYDRKVGRNLTNARIL